ncbi:MAG: glycosyltransferase, partial [Phycisphaeraceae bacterium]
MRVLHIITRLILGGAQQNTVLSCAGQVAAGHEVHLAYGPIYGPEGSLLEEARASGAVLHEVGSMARNVSPVKDLRCYGALRRLVREVRPEVVHTHSSKAGIVGRAAAWAERKSGSPKVLHTVHGLPWHDGMNPLKRRVYVGLERWAARRCDHLIGITSAMVDAFAHEGIISASEVAQKCSVVASGVSFSSIKRPPHLVFGDRMCARCGFPAGSALIALVARLDPLKGHRDLLGALDRIVRARPEARVVFVGDGFDRAGVERAVAESGHTDRVAMLGLVPLAEMGDVYAGVDVVVLPSYQEGQSRVLVEALAAGCAAVGYDVGGIPAVLEATG